MIQTHHRSLIINNDSLRAFDSRFNLLKWLFFLLFCGNWIFGERRTATPTKGTIATMKPWIRMGNHMLIWEYSTRNDWAYGFNSNFIIFSSINWNAWLQSCGRMPTKWSNVNSMVVQILLNEPTKIIGDNAWKNMEFESQKISKKEYA